MTQFNPIRPITQRLNLTPVEDLPRYAGILAASILSCQEVLQASESEKTEISIQIHKLTTRLTSLLQERTPEGRFTGIVLVKAFVEAAGSHQLGVLAPAWVRSLLSCLTKQDPPQVKKLAIITITRVFLLTAGNQATVREVTTPSLPAFLTSCLSLIKPTITTGDVSERQVLSPLLQTVLECWLQLMKAFASTFRPFLPSIRAICLSLVGQPMTPQDAKDIAMQVFATLHFCAPKDNGASYWIQSVELVVESSHQTADLIFRSVIEDWSSLKSRQALPPRGKKNASQVQATDVDACGMERWVGLQAGCSRAVDLLKLLSSMLTSKHAQAVRFPFADVLDLTARYAAVVSPTSAYAMRENKELGRDEREELFAQIPRMHCAVLDLFGRLAITFGGVMSPISQPMLLQLWDIFDAESFDSRVRVAVYKLVKILLQSKAILLRSSDSEHIATLVRKCCSDLEPENTKLSQRHNGTKDAHNGMLGLDLHDTSKRKDVPNQRKSALAIAAWDVLPILLTSIPVSLLTSSTRAEIDRAAILLGHEEALLASVMNPSLPRKDARSTPSVLPFLTTSSDGSLPVEALLRPRMPILREHREVDAGESEDDEDDASMSSEKAASPNVNLLAVTESVTAQLEDDMIGVDTPTAQTIKKRDLEATGEAAATSVEPAKRARIDFQALAFNTDIEPVFVNQSHLDESGTKEFQIDDENSDWKTNAQTETSPMRDRPSEQTGALTSETTAVRPSNDIEDDSDDSEIPQIDTALSSDEDQDEDEELVE